MRRNRYPLPIRGGILILYHWCVLLSALKYALSPTPLDQRHTIITQGKNFNLKAGDTRTEIAALLNSFSSILILGSMTFFAYLKHKSREIKQDRAYSRELGRITEYKENMYVNM